MLFSLSLLSLSFYVSLSEALLIYLFSSFSSQNNLTSGSALPKDIQCTLVRNIPVTNTRRQTDKDKDTRTPVPPWTEIILSNLTRKIKTGKAPPRLAKKDQILTKAYNAPCKRNILVIFDKMSKHPFSPKPHKSSTDISKNF